MRATLLCGKPLSVELAGCGLRPLCLITTSDGSSQYPEIDVAVKVI